VFKNQVTIKTRYAEIDKMGIVHHGVFFEYFELGRTEFMREFCPFPYSQLERQGIYLAVIEAHCEYKNNVSYDEEITITTTLSKLGGARVRFNYEVSAKDKGVLARGYTVHACINSKRRPVRLPEEFFSKLRSCRGGIYGL
jgi:acyl-CoA thioester hydrolase